MPLDTSLFNDLDEGVERHIICTSRLLPDNPLKFSLSTPDRASSAFRRCWQGCPSSNRIKEDISKLTHHMQVIVDHQGCVVPGLGNSGRRYCTGGPTSSNWGGKRRRSQLPTSEHWIHPDAISCRYDVVKEALVKFEGKSQKSWPSSDVPKEEERVERVMAALCLRELVETIAASAEK